MIHVLRPVVEGVFPSSIRRAAARTGTFSLVLAPVVWFLFPASAHAGTETQQARAITAVALAVAGALLRWQRGGVPGIAAATALLVGASFAAPATWLILHAGVGCIYIATALVPRPWGPSQSTAGARPRESGLVRFAVGGAIPAVAGSLGDALVEPAGDDPPVPEAQELIESLAMALVLALVVREFGFEAFKIPTGSMEPTILGDGPGRRGDRLLALKVPEYRRWDIVVFRFPLYRGTNYIKRLIGLPGETLELRGGDVYVNGAIVAKPDDVQSVLWRKVASPAEDRNWDTELEADETSPWRFLEGFAEADAPGAEGGGAAAVSWCTLRQDLASDHRVSFDAEIPGPVTEESVLAISLDGGGRSCELRLREGGATVSMPGGDWEVPMDGLRELGPRFRIGLSMSDRVCRVYLNGRQVAKRQHLDSGGGGGSRDGRARIGAAALALTVRGLVAENDVQYGDRGTTRFEIPADGHVMLGDNTDSSLDSRMWTANVVKLKDGREFVAPDQARLSEDEPPRSVFVRRSDGGVDFHDSYGVRRSFPKDEIDVILHNQPQPYARTSDLVGRAFLIFFPFPPAGDFRPRLLR